MSLSIRLKQARDALGKSQKEMANLLDISFRSWQGYENGKNKPGSDVITALIKVGFNANWLLTGEGRMNNDVLTLERLGTKNFSICIDVVMKYQDSLKEKMSNEEHSKLLILLCKIVSDQRIEWQTEEKAKEILSAILKINEFYKLY